AFSWASSCSCRVLSFCQSCFSSSAHSRLCLNRCTFNSGESVAALSARNALAPRQSSPTRMNRSIISAGTRSTPPGFWPRSCASNGWGHSVHLCPVFPKQSLPTNTEYYVFVGNFVANFVENGRKPTKFWEKGFLGQALTNCAPMHGLTLRH